MLMLDIVNVNTKIYQNNTKKEDRKKKGQFFTPLTISKYMSSMSKNKKKRLKILDCGAGTGILGVSLLEKLIKDDIVEEIEIDFYENDKEVLDVLNKEINELEEILNNKKIKLTIIEENFILYNKEIWNDSNFNGIYDIIISNPPYKKLNKQSEESVALESIVYGQPNIYFLFMAMAIKLLNKDGEMIFITPRSFTSGAYFKKFRKYLIDNITISNIHIFDSRNELFKGEEVLQEAIITRCVKNSNIKYVEITSSQDSNLDISNKIKIEYSKIVDNKSENRFILIPSTKEDINVLNLMRAWNKNLIDIGLKLKTGPVVDFRAKKFLTNEYIEGETVPLFWSDNFVENTIKYINNTKNYRFILNTKDSNKLMVKNKDYLLVKRFTSKEEKRRIQIALYEHEKFSEYKEIGIENHVNYIVKQNGNFEKEELYGVFCLFNSSLIDRYYRILNGNTQVNATEANSIPLPEMNKIKELGKELLKSNDLSTEKCDYLINYVFRSDLDEKSRGSKRNIKIS